MKEPANTKKKENTVYRVLVVGPSLHIECAAMEPPAAPQQPPVPSASASNKDREELEKARWNANNYRFLAASVPTFPVTKDAAALALGLRTAAQKWRESTSRRLKLRFNKLPTVVATGNRRIDTVLMCLEKIVLPIVENPETWKAMNLYSDLSNWRWRGSDAEVTDEVMRERAASRLKLRIVQPNPPEIRQAYDDIRFSTAYARSIVCATADEKTPLLIAEATRWCVTGDVCTASELIPIFLATVLSFAPPSFFGEPGTPSAVTKLEQMKKLLVLTNYASFKQTDEAYNWVGIFCDYYVPAALCFPLIPLRTILARLHPYDLQRFSLKTVTDIANGTARFSDRKGNVNLTNKHFLYALYAHSGDGIPTYDQATLVFSEKPRKVAPISPELQKWLDTFLRMPGVFTNESASAIRALAATIDPRTFYDAFVAKYESIYGIKWKDYAVRAMSYVMPDNGQTVAEHRQWLGQQYDEFNWYNIAQDELARFQRYIKSAPAPAQKGDAGSVDNKNEKNKIKKKKNKKKNKQKAVNDDDDGVPISPAPTTADGIDDGSVTYIPPAGEASTSSSSSSSSTGTASDDVEQQRERYQKLSDMAEDLSARKTRNELERIGLFNQIQRIRAEEEVKRARKLELERELARIDRELAELENTRTATEKVLEEVTASGTEIVSRLVAVSLERDGIQFVECGMCYEVFPRSYFYVGECGCSHYCMQCAELSVVTKMFCPYYEESHNPVLDRKYPNRHRLLEQEKARQRGQLLL